MKTSESTSNIFQAMVKAQEKVTNLYPSSSGYGYNYVPLEKIIDMLKVVLPQFGLSYIQLPENESGDGLIGLTTRIIHTSGEWVESTASFPLTDMKGVNKSQAAGAAITYFRRYGLCAAFGITGDKDVDANDKAFQQAAVNNSAYTEEQKSEIDTELRNYIQSGAFDGDPKTKERAKTVLAGLDYEKKHACLEYAKSGAGRKTA